MILAGAGAGQWRHVVGHSGRTWRVDRPWAVLPDASSQVQVSPMRGHLLFVANSWSTGYTVQLYAQALSAVVAENTLDATPLISWGLNPHGWGYQPNWRVEIVGNRLPNSHGLTVQTSTQGAPGSDPWLFNGPLAQGIALRRNWVNGSGIYVGSGSGAGPSDVLVESNEVSRLGSRPGFEPIHLGNHSHLLERGNVLFG